MISSGFCFGTDMTHFVLLQHMVLQNMHRNNKHKSLQRSKMKNTQTSYRKLKYMHTYNTVPCKHSPFWEVNYLRFAFLSHVSNISCLLAIHTWHGFSWHPLQLQQEVACRKLLISKWANVWLMKVIRFLSLTLNT